MYRKDILEKLGIKPPTTFDEFTAAVKQITEAEKANGIFGTGLQAKSGHYSLNATGPRRCGAMAARSSAPTRSSRAMTSKASTA